MPKLDICLRRPILATRYVNTTRSAALAITTSANATTDTFGFNASNSIQCQIQLVAKNFEVAAYTGNSTIAVLPGEEIEWPDYVDILLTTVTYDIAEFTHVDGAFLGSKLGLAMRLDTMF